MPKATWNGQILAESDHVETVEGNAYFPPDSLHREFFKENPQSSICPWKGKAHYYDVVVNGDENAGAAWYYPNPSEAAAKIKDHVAFWKGVRVEP